MQSPKPRKLQGKLGDLKVVCNVRCQCEVLVSLLLVKSVLSKKGKIITLLIWLNCLWIAVTSLLFNFE